MAYQSQLHGRPSSRSPTSDAFHQGKLANCRPWAPDNFGASGEAATIVKTCGLAESLQVPAFPIGAHAGFTMRHGESSSDFLVLGILWDTA